MIYMSKEDGDKLLEDFVINISKRSQSQELASESMNVLNDNLNKTILLASLMVKIKDSIRTFDEGQFDMKSAVFEALDFCFGEETSEDEYVVPTKLKGLFNDDPEFSWKNPKLQFAVDQFVTAFYIFEQFEQKYPNLTEELIR